MRILFLTSSSIWIHNLPEGFREAGHEMKNSGPIVENNILNLINEFKPSLLISMGWGSDQNIDKQYIIRKCIKLSKIPHVYWSIEDPLFTNVFSLPLIQRVRTNFVFSNCLETVTYFKKVGIKAAYMDFGYSPKIHCPIKQERQYKSSIAIVANAYPHILKKFPDLYRNIGLKNLVSPLLKEGIRIDFWGNDWNNMNQFLGCNIPNEYIHGYIPYINATKVYCSADIIIGLQNYTNQVTQRTYEILASGGFLLTSNTLGVRNLFKPGKDLVVSSSPEETLKMVRYYLKRPNERRKISEQGCKSIFGNSYKDRAEYMIRVLKKENIL